MDASPPDRDREYARGLRRTDVERRVADVDSLVRRALRASRPRSSTGSGSGLWRSVSSCATTTSNELASAGKRARARPTVRCRFAVTIPSLRPFGLQPRQELEQLVERLQRLVQPVVVLLVDRRASSSAWSDVDARSSARRFPGRRWSFPSSSARDLAPEHGPHRVLHRREDDRPRVDQRAVEVEQDDREAHSPATRRS